MNYLAIDTSGENLTIIAEKGDKTEIVFEPDCGVRHSVSLMPKTEEVLEKLGAKLSDFDFFACVVGAGSFTGIRIGISTVKGLCFAANKPCLPVTSFDTIAYNIQQGKVMAIMDALHGSYYVCGYENGKVVFPPEFIGKDELLSLKEEYTFLSGKKIDGVETEVVSIVDGFIKAIENKKNEITFDAEKLVPLYIRKSQAEEGR